MKKTPRYKAKRGFFCTGFKNSLAWAWSMICARWTLRRSNPLLVFFGFPPSFGLIFLSSSSFFFCEHDGIFSSNPPRTCTLQAGCRRCEPYIKRIPLALPSRAWQSRILYGWCQIYLLTHVPVCASLPGGDLLNIWRRSEATGRSRTARCYFNTHHYHTISPFSVHPSFPSTPGSLWSSGERTTGLWHPLRAKPFSLTSWDGGGGRNRPACVWRFPWGALALDAGPDQCDLNSNCELEGCQWERTLCKWAQAAWGPRGPPANQVPPPNTPNTLLLPHRFNKFQMGDPATAALTSSHSSRGAPQHVEQELNSAFSTMYLPNQGKQSTVLT